MAFKLKNDKASLFGIDGALSTCDTPVFMKELDGDVIAEANRDGTIFVDRKASPAQKREAIAHENVHLEQMKQGRLNYTDDSVIWKKDTKAPQRIYSRDNMNEGAANLEWEDEAYKRTRNIKRKRK